MPLNSNPIFSALTISNTTLQEFHVNAVVRIIGVQSLRMGLLNEQLIEKDHYHGKIPLPASLQDSFRSNIWSIYVSPDIIESQRDLPHEHWGFYRINPSDIAETIMARGQAETEVLYNLHQKATMDLLSSRLGWRDHEDVLTDGHKNQDEWWSAIGGFYAAHRAGHDISSLYQSVLQHPDLSEQTQWILDYAHSVVKRNESRII